MKEMTPLQRRYEIRRQMKEPLPTDPHHELCEVTCGRKLGYWAEDMCDCKKESECKQ